jgi:hypothetical protein
MGVCLNPLTIFPVFPSLGYFTDVDFRIKVGCKGFSVVTCIAVNNIKGMYFVKMMSGGKSGENSCDPWVKASP